MGSLTITRLASCLPVLACMCALACLPTDEFDDDGDDSNDIATLREADALLLACSEANGPIDLLVDPDGIVWLDGERQLSHAELVVAVGDAMSVMLCMEFAEPGDQARVSAHDDGTQLLLGGDSGTGSCVVMLRPVVIDSNGRRWLGALELDIDPLEPVPALDEGFDVFYLAPVKSSGKVKVVGSCPKFNVDSP